MSGFCLAMTVRLASNGLNAIKRDIDESMADGTAPVTFWVMGGVLLGATVAGFVGAVVGGVAGVMLCDVFKTKTVTA